MSCAYPRFRPNRRAAAQSVSQTSILAPLIAPPVSSARKRPYRDRPKNSSTSRPSGKSAGSTAMIPARTWLPRRVRPRRQYAVIETATRSPARARTSMLRKRCPVNGADRAGMPRNGTCTRHRRRAALSACASVPVVSVDPLSGESPVISATGGCGTSCGFRTNQIAATKTRVPSTIRIFRRRGLRCLRV